MWILLVILKTLKELYGSLKNKIDSRLTRSD